MTSKKIKIDGAEDLYALLIEKFEKELPGFKIKLLTAYPTPDLYIQIFEIHYWCCTLFGRSFRIKLGETLLMQISESWLHKNIFYTTKFSEYFQRHDKMLDVLEDVRIKQKLTFLIRWKMTLPLSLGGFLLAF